ncbi:MAG: hypothetical protein ACREDP_22395 [Bradyrhizobium sp.]
MTAPETIATKLVLYRTGPETITLYVDAGEYHVVREADRGGIIRDDGYASWDDAAGAYERAEEGHP